jgi:ATP-grasp domain-containing protein
MSLSGNILILNRWPQYPNSERWDNELARYDDLIPHDRYRVTYICDPVGQQGVPITAQAVHSVRDFADTDGIMDLVGKLIPSHGPFDHLIAFSEYLLDIAATIRERYDIPGPRPREVDRVRDKTFMKQVLQNAGIRVPRWFRYRSIEQVLADAQALGFPLILKPMRGASSQGVRKITSAEELTAVCRSQRLDDYEIEEYIDGDVLHADGVVDGEGACLFMSISRYISSCLEFESGGPLGSIIQTDSAVRAECRHFAHRCLAALELKASAFHLEFFATGRELVFLEIGARVPGADVSYVVHDVYGVNLFRLWVDVLLGHQVESIRDDGEESGGWLIIARPQPLPQKVVHSTALLGKIPFLYRELVPKPGQILEHAGGYANFQGGRFLFRGGTQSEIVEAVRAAQSEYRLMTTV